MAKSIRQLPIVVDIPVPCQADWNAMTGDDRVRHCSLCNKDVHALSALDEANVVALLGQGNVCVRLQVASDGAIVSKDRKASGRAARVVATAALAALAACSQHGEPQLTMGSPPVPVVVDAGATPAASASAVAPLPEPTTTSSAAQSTPKPTAPPLVQHTMGKPLAPPRLGGAIRVVHGTDPLRSGY